MFGPGRAAPKWVVPLHPTRRDRAFGVQFCPECLASDRSPYFRLHWRLGFVTCCASHSVMLLEVCPRCGQPPWPGCSVIPGLFRDSDRRDIARCALCEFDLRVSAKAFARNRINAWLVDGRMGAPITLSESVSVSAADFATALWVTCQLFVRVRSASLMASQATEHGELASTVLTLGVKSVELLPVDIRHRVIDVAASLFESWPDMFIGFAKSHGISAAQFSESRSSLPRWYLRVVDEDLARQKRRITRGEVEAACEAVVRAGKKVTRAEIGRVLGSRYAGVVVDATATRRQASMQERLEFLERLRAYARARQKRSSSSEVRLRNAIVLGLCVSMRIPASDAFKLSHRDVLAHVKDRREDLGDRFVRKLVVLVSKWVRQYDRLRLRRGDKRLVQPGAPYFESFRGGKTPERAIREALRLCMADFESALERSPHVFVDLLSACAPQVFQLSRRR
jgi:hypothetical protein